MSHVWVIVTVPKKEYERYLTSSKDKDQKRSPFNDIKSQFQSNNIKSDAPRPTTPTPPFNPIPEFGDSKFPNNVGNNLNSPNNNNDKNNNNPNDSNYGRDDPNSMQQILEDSLKELEIEDAAWVLSKNGCYWHVYFPVEMLDSDAVLQFLSGQGIGNRGETSIGMIPFSLYYQNVGDDEDEDDDVFDEPGKMKSEKEPVAQKLTGFKAIQQKFLRSVTARLTVAQVVNSIQSGAEITFDFVCYVIFASWIAAMGLLDNSVVSTVASMLVSPMMGPVMAMTFGVLIRDQKLRNLGIRNYCFCLMMCVLFGYFYGLICLNFTEEWNPLTSWPTEEMASRGRSRILWVGALVALPSGGAIAVSLLAGNQASLVGVAISASLLPPCVNAGLLWAYSTIHALRALNEQWPADGGLPPSLIQHKEYKNVWYSPNASVESGILGIVSIGLSLVNVICIFIMACIVLKIKEIAPLSSMTPAAKRFFHEDIRIAREYNRSTQGIEAENLGRDFLREWANISGIDEKEFMSDKPEARVTQLQTLQDLVEDAEQDETYQTIMRQRGPPEIDIVSRISGPSDQSRRNSVAPGLGFKRESIFDIESGVRRPSFMNGTIGGGGRRGSRMSQMFSNMTSNILGGGRRESRTNLTGSVDALHINPIHHSPPPGPLRQVSESEVHLRGQRLSVFGMPSNLNDMLRRRRSSAALRRSLQVTDHSPYSVWPQAGRNNRSRFVVTPVAAEVPPVQRRRLSRAARLSSSTSENQTQM